MEKIVAKLRFQDQCRIAVAMFMDEAKIPIVCVTGIVIVIAQGQPLGKFGHGGPRMIVIQRIASSPLARQNGRAGFGIGLEEVGFG